MRKACLQISSRISRAIFVLARARHVCFVRGSVHALALLTAPGLRHLAQGPPVPPAKDPVATWIRRRLCELLARQGCTCLTSTDRGGSNPPWVAVRIYVCFYVCNYVCTHLRIYVCNYGCIYACMHGCTHVCRHDCMYACVRACMCADVCLHPSMYVRMSGCFYACTRA